MDKISVTKGDIVRSKTDAIVNAANTSLLGGGGVDAAIHAAAGIELLAECEKLSGCKTGEAKITKGYRLRAKYVIHTPGPIWRGGGKGEADLLASCYNNCLKIAEENEIKSISFPSISTGVYKFPVDEAAKIAVASIYNFLNKNTSIEKVVIVCYDDKTFKSYKDQLDKIIKLNQK